MGLSSGDSFSGLVPPAKTSAWRLTLAGENVPFWRLAGIRLAAGATGQFGIIDQVFGDGMRISLLSQNARKDSVISSVTLERGLFMIAGAVTSIIGIAA